MSEIENAQLTVTVTGPEIVKGGRYLAEDSETQDNGELREFVIIDESELAYLIDEVRYNPVWILKDRIINTGEMNRSHVYKIIEKLPNGT